MSSQPVPYEIVPRRSRAAPFVLICEHASNRLHEWRAEPGDEPLLADHWGFDIGAAHVTRCLARETGSSAVLSCFSRLVCDPNRSPDEPSFVVEQIEGHRISWNRDVDAVERARRRQRYFDPYHDAVDRAVQERLALGPMESSSFHLVSIHSFTPVHSGERRKMQMGILFDSDEPSARRLARAFAGAGFEVALNEPYSGHAGMIYSVRRHGRAQGVPYLELEIRQDLIEDVASAEAVAGRVVGPLLEALAPAQCGGDPPAD